MMILLTGVSHCFNFFKGLSKEKNQDNQIDKLPNELILLIFKQCSVEDIGKCSCVSKKWNRLCNQNDLWTKMYQKKFGKKQRLKEGESAKENYKKELNKKDFNKLVDKAFSFLSFLEVPNE